MARDTKVGMLLGLGIILLVGIFVSDYLRPVENPPSEAATDFAGAAMDRGGGAGQRPQRQPAPAFHDASGAAPDFRAASPPATPVQQERPGPGDDMVAAPTGFSAPPPAWRATTFQDPPEGTHATPFPVGVDPLVLEPSRAPVPIADPRLGTRGGERSLQVRTGDTLAQLAFELYGATGYAEALAAANPHAIDITGRPVPGATLIVPDHAGLVAAGRATASPAANADRGAVPEVLILPPPARDLRPAAPGTAADPAPRDTPEPSFFEVTVGPGDTLSQLASEHLGDAQRFEELFEANRDRLRSPDSVQLGMTLRVPRAVGPGSAAPASPGRSSVAGVATYTVQPGDSLSRIAARVLGDADRWEELFEANRDTLASPDRVVVGQQLRVPG